MFRQLNFSAFFVLPERCFAGSGLLLCGLPLNEPLGNRWQYWLLSDLDDERVPCIASLRNH